MASCKLSAFIKYRQLSTSNSFLWRHQFEFLIKILRHCIFHKFLNLSIRNKKVNYTRFCPETLHLTPGSIVLFQKILFGRSVTNPEIHYSVRNSPPVLYWARVLHIRSSEQYLHFKIVGRTCACITHLYHASHSPKFNPYRTNVENRVSS